jgi:hypothetical protein
VVASVEGVIALCVTDGKVASDFSVAVVVEGVIAVCATVGLALRSAASGGKVKRDCM